MPNLEISKERVEDAINIIIQFMRDAGYEGSLEDGTGISDVLIKPAALLREMFAQMADRVTAYQSLQRAGELRSQIGEEEYDAAVDCILSNWFVTRNEGRPSRGVVRMWFTKPLDFMHVKDGERLGTIGSEGIVADGEQVRVEGDFSYILNTNENKNEYYIDFTVRTRDYSSLAPEITSDAQSGIVWPDIHFLRTTIPQDFIAGEEIESSSAFITRTEEAITTRELITSRAIKTVLLDNFPDIIRLYTARHGSSEQLRDIVYFQKVRVHVGNKADIYLSTAPGKQVISVIADENGIIDTEQLPGNVSAIDYLSATNEDGLPLRLDIKCDETRWGSNGYLPDKITVNATGPVELTILTDTVLNKVDTFVNSEKNRVAINFLMRRLFGGLQTFPFTLPWHATALTKFSRIFCFGLNRGFFPLHQRPFPYILPIVR